MFLYLSRIDFEDENLFFIFSRNEIVDLNELGNESIVEVLSLLYGHVSESKVKFIERKFSDNKLYYMHNCS